MTTPPTPAQKLTVLLAFVSAALSFSVLLYSLFRTGAIQATPLFGGLLMLVLGLSGYARLRQQASSAREDDATPPPQPPQSAP